MSRVIEPLRSPMRRDTSRDSAMAKRIPRPRWDRSTPSLVKYLTEAFKELVDGITARLRLDHVDAMQMHHTATTGSHRLLPPLR